MINAPKFSVDSRVIASPVDNTNTVSEFSIVVVDIAECDTDELGFVYIVRDQDDDVWQCTELELEADDNS
jgi:hypothetical protein